MIDLSILIKLLSDFPALIAYINRGKSFPKPLSKELELEYIKKMRSGDRNARDKLIEHNLRLVAHIAKKYCNALDNDDIISIGSIGLIKAVNTFDETKGTHLATYAARCIENEILMSIRSNKKRCLEVSLSDPIGTDKEGNSITLLDILGSDKDGVMDEAAINIRLDKIREQACKNLNKRERFIINSRYGLSDKTRLTQREIAKALGISRSYVSRIEKKAVGILRDALCDD